MLIRNFTAWVILIFLSLLTIPAHGQKKVDLDQAESENPDLFSGSYFRAGIGFARANYNYHTTYKDVVISPVSLNLQLGKRMNRKLGAYFGFTGNMELSEREVGLADRLQYWINASMHLGGNYYILGGNTYFGAEAGVGLGHLRISASGVNSTLRTYGMSSALKYGYDWHLAASFFTGLQLFISYARMWDPERSVVQTGKHYTSNSLLYGATLNIKVGK